jgi:hypothetical protein
MPYFSFRHEGYEYFKVRAKTKEKALEILENDPDDGEPFFTHAEVAMDFDYVGKFDDDILGEPARLRRGKKIKGG